MAIEFDPPIVAGTTLVRDAIQSQNYASASDGWIIEADGDAEFNNLVIRGTFEGQNFAINENGMFQYNGIPALGNLIASFTNAAGIDPFGNDYLSGLTTYNAGSTYSQVNAGFQLYGRMDATVPNTGEAAEIISNGNTLDLLSPTDIANGLNDRSFIGIGAGVNGITLPTGNEPFVSIASQGSSVASLKLTGAVVKSSSLGNPYTWQNPSYAANWSGNTNWNGNGANLYPTMRFRFDGEDNVWIYGMAQASGAGTTIFTLPVGYRPPNGFRGMLDANFNIGGTAISGHVQITEAGAVACNSSVSGSAITIAAGSQIYINGKFPLGNLP